MTDRLTREQCIALRDGGLEQKLKKGDWVYYNGELKLTLFPDSPSPDRSEIVKLPSLDELMAFVNETCRNRGWQYFSMDRGDTNIWWVHTGHSSHNIHASEASVFLSAALFALWQKIKEKP
jgi:hypothetical protein